MLKISLLSTVGTVALYASAGLAQSAADRADAYRAELMADAAGRTSLLAGGGGAGFEKGKVTIHDDSGANTLWIGGTVQFRYSADFRDDSGVGDEEDFTHGFSSRRTRLRFGGSIWDKSLTYLIQLDTSRSTGEVGLVDAFGQYKWDNGVALKWGQYKLPFLREESVSDTSQLAVDYSVMHTVFTQSRSQGIELSYDAGNVRFAGDFSDGIRTANTDFNNNAEADFALTGRVDWMFAGDNWKRFDDYTSWRGSDYAGMIGAAVHYQDGGDTGGIDSTGAADGTNDRTLFMATVDTQIEGNGWNLASAVVYRSDENDESSDQDAFSDWGLLVQGGVFVADQVETFLRYDVIFMDGDRTAAPDGEDSFHTLTAGANCYVSPDSHAVKVSGQVMYFFNPTTDIEILSPSTTTPLLADSEDGQVSAVVQVQVVF